MPHNYLPACSYPGRLALLLVFTGAASAAFGQTPTFAPIATYASGVGTTNPYSVAVADVN